MRGVMEIGEPLADARPVSGLNPAALSRREIWRAPLPGARGKFQLRFFTRATLGLFRKKFLDIRGAEIIRDFHRPYVMVANHSVRYEALLLPALVNFLREGRPIHFLADWNFRLYPFLGHLMKVGESITVVRKPAKPAFLNLLKPFFEDGVPPLERARLCLRRGEPVGIFPEGTRNPNPARLLRGDRGAAWLSLRANAPILPVGIRFPQAHATGRVEEFAPLEIEFGKPLYPAARLEGRASDLDAVKEWHGTMMLEISRLSRKTWTPKSKRKKYESD